MNKGIEMEVLWWDNDVIKLEFRCSNGCFSGQTELYMGHDGFLSMATTLNGFSSHVDDSRKVELGAMDSSYAGGGVSMNFHCVDSAAHAVVDLKVRNGDNYAFDESESVVLRIPVEAAAVDS